MIIRLCCIWDFRTALLNCGFSGLLEQTLGQNQRNRSRFWGAPWFPSLCLGRLVGLSVLFVSSEKTTVTLLSVVVCGRVVLGSPRAVKQSTKQLTKP